VATTSRGTQKRSSPSTASKRTNAKSQSGGSRATSARRTQARPSSNGQSAQTESKSQSTNGRGRLVKVALGAVGTAAIGVAGAAAAARKPRRPQVLGVSLPKELAPRNLNPAKLAKKVDVNKLVKQIGNAAEQVEAHSDDVRMVSGQVKRLTKKLG
jgi:hypothetical protein